MKNRSGCRNDEDFRLEEVKKELLRKLKNLQHHLFSGDKKEYGSYNFFKRSEIMFFLRPDVVASNPRLWSDLTTKAKTDPKYYDACRYAYAFCRKNEVLMPEELKDWVVHALYEGEPTSGKPGPDPMVNEGRDILIAQQVEIAHKYFGIPLYNKTSPEKTACGLVKDCLSELHFDESYETIYTIYKKRKTGE